MGLTVGQVVHGYGDVCQVVTELAVQQKVPISSEDFRLMNLCLDDAIAGAVTEYARQRENAVEDRGTERLGVLAHETRNLLNAGTLAFRHIKSGSVGVDGSTGAVLDRCLTGLSELVDRSLADVRLDAGIERLERISVADFLEDVERSKTNAEASLLGKPRNCFAPSSNEAPIEAGSASGSPSASKRRGRTGERSPSRTFPAKVASSRWRFPGDQSDPWVA